MAKKRIVHLISSLQVGGAQAFLYDLIIGLGSEEFEHQVIYFHTGPFVDRLQQLGIRTHQVKGLISLYDPAFWWRLYRLLKEINPSAIHAALWAANLSGRLLGKLLGIRVICAIHSQSDFNGKLRTFIDRFTLHLAWSIVPVSEGVAHSLPNRWLPAHKMQIIRNGINSKLIVERGQVFKKSRPELGIHSDQFVIGTVGRFIPTKQLLLLIQSFDLLYKHNKNVHLILVGFGPEEERLRQEVAKRGLELVVTFIIGQPSYGYYPLFDCFVLPSTSEGLSIALLEAMSFGLPCIVTSMSKIHEVITDQKDGFVVAGNDNVALGEALYTFAADAQLRNKIGESAFELIEKKFNLRATVNSYRKLLHGL